MIFVDTSFWVALATRADNHHVEAAALWERRPLALVTTNLVLGETWTFLNRRNGHKVAWHFVAPLRQSDSVAIESCSTEVEEEAWSWLERRDERKYSFVDATSFAVMRRQRVRDAFAFDGDFAAAGFVEVRP